MFPAGQKDYKPLKATLKLTGGTDAVLKSICNGRGNFKGDSRNGIG